MRSILVVGLVAILAAVAQIGCAAAPAEATAATQAGPVVRLASVAEFDALLARTEGDLVLYFTATWCGPCKKMAPQLAAFATANRDVVVAAVDVDALADIAQRYRIQSMPTLVHVRKGVEAKRGVGYRATAAITAWVRGN